MKSTWMCLIPLALGVVGCQNALHDENRALRQQNIELQDSLRKKDTELSGRPSSSDIATLQAAMAEKDRQIADLQTQINKPAPGETATPEEGGFGKGITVTRDDKAGTITVNVPGDVLFTSGDANVKESAKATLGKIAGIIKKEFSGKKIFVDGHTDSDPIVKTAKLWKDNLDLSAARARSVADYIETQGIDKSRVGTRAFGATEPKSSKEKSRRVEIVVVTR